jgi:hypothetical protein
MIEMAIKTRITKVSRAFAVAYPYTAPGKERPRRGETGERNDQIQAGIL